MRKRASERGGDGTAAARWILQKLRDMGARLAEPEPPVAAARVTHPKRERKRDITECPADVDPLEWQEALRAVEMGSARSTIRANSDLPSDEQVRRERLWAARPPGPRPKAAPPRATVFPARFDP